MRWTDRLIGVLSTIVLARLLVPDDFGIIAMCSLFIGLVDVLLDLGVNVALIQNRHPTQEHYDTAWTMRILQSALAAVLVVAAAPFVADYFGDQRITVVLRVLSVGLLLAGLENIGVVTFQKEMEFGRDFRFLFSKRIVGFCITLGAAWYLRSYWALVIGTLAGRSVGVLLSYAMHPMRPRPSFARLREIFAVSQWMIAHSTGIYLHNNLHRILVGGRESTAVMGGYTLANEVSSMPTTELLAPLNRVLFPTFVQAKHDLAELKRLFLLAQGVQTLVAIPASVGLALVAPEAVSVLLGEKWLFAVPFVQVLALASVVQAITTSGTYVLITLGRVRKAAMLAWTQVLFFAAIAFLAIPRGRALDLAYARLVVVFAGLWLAVWFLKRALPGLRLAEMGTATVRPLLAVVVMAAALLSLGRPESLSVLATLAVKILTGAFVYATALTLIWQSCGMPKGAESYVKDTLVKALGRR